MKISDNGINFIAGWEGVEYKAYKDAVGLWTVAIGHLIKLPEEKFLLNKTLTREEVYDIFREDIKRFENNLNKVIKVPINQNQFDALISLAFNIGNGAFNNSTLLRVLNQGNYEEVPNQILRWDKAGGKTLLGLTRRRKAEVELFNKPLEEVLYSDVEKGDWFYEPIKWATQVGLTNGYPDGTFKPNKVITRAEIMALLYKFKDL